MTAGTNPAALHEYDPGWPVRAQAELIAIRSALTGLPGSADAFFDHIGSTSVPGLAAKPFLDLQVRIQRLPDDAALTARLGPLGYTRARGSRPDSPGVFRDLARGSERVDPEVWTKSLFFHENDSVILHIRRTDSPFGRYVVWFRDWLRAHPDQRDRYEAVKRQLSAQNIGKSDYDDYTHAKTVFFDEVQSQFEAWGTARSTSTRCDGPPSR